MKCSKALSKRGQLKIKLKKSFRYNLFIAILYFYSQICDKNDLGHMTFRRRFATYSGFETHLGQLDIKQ